MSQTTWPVSRSRSWMTGLVAVAILVWLLPNPAVLPQQPQILSLAQSVQLPQASIWGGISYNGDSISVTSTLSQGTPHLYLRKVGTSLNALGSPLALTTSSDSVTSRHITDHKQLFLNGCHFVVFSVEGDSDLYILKTDRDGTRIGPITPVVEGTSSRTNDMMFTTDGDLLYVAYFKPNDQSVVHVLNQDLEQVRTPLETSRQLAHNNLGGLHYSEGKFFMFTGDKAGPDSNLIATVWNHDWTPAMEQPRRLLAAPSGGGYFFATGIAFDRVGRRWYLAFHHVLNSNPDATTHIDLAVFSESFQLLGHLHGDPGFRPHLLLRDTSLYMVYDAGGVFLRRYDIRGAAVVSQGPGVMIFPDARNDERLSTGVAVVNPTGNQASLEIAAYSENGDLLRWPGAANPASSLLPKHGQRADVTREFFQAASFPGGWLKVTSDESAVRAFFLDFDSSGTVMDGSPAIDAPLSYFVLPARAGDEILLVNPGTAGESAVTLQIIGGDGLALGGSHRLGVPALSRRVVQVSELAPGSIPADAYLQGTASLPVAVLERSALANDTLAMINGSDANGGARVLFAPQYVSGSGYVSRVKITNLDDAPTKVMATFVDDKGGAAGSPLAMQLAARGCVVLDDDRLRVRAEAGTAQGYVRIDSTNTRIAGSAQFGSGSGSLFETILPLTHGGSTHFVFPHIASDSRYFTGAAWVNPAAEAADWVLSVFGSSGQIVARTTGTLPAGARISRLLTQLLPGLPSMAGGYFTLSSTVPLAGFSVFGTTGLSSLGAISAQEIQDPGFEGAGRDEDYLGVADDSDFEPPRGGVAGGPGPAMFRLMTARSGDGLGFARENRILADQGAVPDLVADRSGTLYLYYTAWTVGRQINKTVVAISKDGGSSWSFRRLELERREGETDLVDPDVLVLPDGTFRLYVTIGGGQSSYARSHYFDSPDGIHFQRRGVAFDPGGQALDPSTLRIGSTYHIFAGGAGDNQQNWHGTSADGSVYQFDRLMRFAVNGFGQMMANGLAVEGGYRFYCFGNDRLGGISSLFTVDGVTWTADAGSRLTADSSSRFEGGPPTDPAIVRLPDGSYLMVYSCSIRRSN